MKSKEIVKKALNHQQPNRIPIDLGGGPTSGLHVSTIENLRNYYGLVKRTVKAYEPFQMLGIVEDDLAEALGVDITGCSSNNTMFGFKNENWKEWKTPWGQNVLVADKFNTSVKENGNILIYPEGDTTAEASGLMPKTSFFFDAIDRQPPIDEEKLNYMDNTEEYTILNDIDIKEWKKKAELLKNTDKAVFANIGGSALGDIALVPAVNLKRPKGIRDITEWYMSTVTRKDYIHQVFSYQCEVAIKNMEKLLPILKDVVDIAFVCGTDFGTQNSTFCSERTYRKLYMPYHKIINNWIHKNTNWKTFKHSCGAIYKFIPAFIESGFDIINPVQCSAKGMDPRMLKNEYGNDIVFWGGGVDTQHTLPFGSPEDVKKEVLERCRIFSPGGGFVFNTVHNIQALTPTENIIAMVDAVREFNDLGI